MQAWQISLILAAVLAIAEVLTLSFILLGFAIGMALVALLQFFGDGYSAVRDISVFAIGSLVATLAFRTVFKRRRDQSEATEDVNRY
jgi:membrane protein implicated in regulation of membrane protease activity